MRNRHFWIVVASVVAGNVWSQPVEPDPGVDGMPVVITPTRLRQSLADVPASVTVITQDMFRRWGITSIAEALRFVPGMAVTRGTDPAYRIGYHGTNVLSPRRMNVLIDGISVYRPAFSEVIWSQLPVVIDDIDRIEVTRAPSSASYGPNSMLAVVNIITRHPADVGKAYGALRLGTQESEVVARTGLDLGRTSLSLTAARSRDTGYDELARDPAGHDGLTLDHLNLRSSTRISDAASLDLQGAVVSGESEVEFADDFQQSYPDRRVRDLYLGALGRWQLSPRHELQVQLTHARQRNRQSWRSCPPAVALLPEMYAMWRANPAYANAILAGQQPAGGSPQDDLLALTALQAIAALGPAAVQPVCGTLNQDAVQSRTDLEIQDTFVASDALRVVAGAGMRWQGGDSETFLGGSVTSRLHWLFANVDLRPRNWLTLNIGGYYEDSDLSPSTFSPRVAANLRLSPRQTVRFAVSHGTRSPDIQEQRTNWSYTLTDLDPPLGGATTARFYQSRVGPGSLTSERVRSREIGYLLNMPEVGLMLDTRVFRERLYDLISERTNLAGLPPTNDNRVTLQGAEVQLSWQLSERSSAFVNYAYLDNRGASHPLERSQYSRHSGSVGVSREFAGGWLASAAYVGASGNGLAESAYGREDLTVGREWATDGWQWSFAAGLRRLDQPVTTYSNGAPSALYGRYDSRLQGYLQLSARMR